ncbi:hypothetical protein Mapa_016359 [Marchantia paleacea]|nr:hypothetical protein Mapa_016359 [Marchantia paleacea]
MWFMICPLSTETDNWWPLGPTEIVGKVAELGSEVTKFKVGDRVGVGCMVNSCRRCDACAKDVEHYCENGCIWTYNSEDVDKSVTYGGYSNFMVITEDFALKVPENLPMDAAAALLCAGITVYSPMKHYEMEKGGKNFGVVGLAGLGHLATKIAKAMGMNVTVISTSLEKEKEAREKLGADNFIVSKDEEQMMAAKRALDFIIYTVSVDHAVDPYLALLKTNGNHILVGMPASKLSISPISMKRCQYCGKLRRDRERGRSGSSFSFYSSLIFYRTICAGRKTVGGSLIEGIAETQEMLDFCGKDNVVCEIENMSMDYVNTAMERLEKSDVHYRLVIDCEKTL